MSRVTIDHLPQPDCPYGYTVEQLARIFGERLDAFNRWMRGSTMIVCNGRKYDHEQKQYVDSLCAESPHGVVTYSHDVERFLRGLPQDD